VALFVWSYI